LLASPSPSSHSHGKAHAHMKPETRVRGDRPTVLLLGIRLGLDRVNPVYYETIKVCILLLLSLPHL
jgi:cysteine protease ATG4